MIALLQRVSSASVDVAGERIGALGQGLMVLVGVQPQDDERTALGFIPTRWEARPDDRLFFVSDTVGTVEDGVYVVRWNATPRDPKDIAKANAMAEIVRLEESITDRMWIEDATGSTAMIQIKKQDENGDWVVDTDDPRTGKTATQYIAYVNSAIANIRTGL